MIVYILLFFALIAQTLYFRRKIYWIEHRLDIHKDMIGRCELRKDLKQWDEHS